MYKIMFVCHGNICRSVMAEFIMKEIVRKNHQEQNYEIDSTATSYEEIGNDIYPPAKKVLLKNNIHFDKHEARRITKEEYDACDICLIMDSNNERNLYRIVNRDDKTLKLGSFANLGDISDPWYSNKFDECFNEIKMSCEKLYQYLESKNA